MEKRLSITEAAAIIGIDKRTLRSWIKKGIGPAHFELNKRLLFTLADLKAFEASRRKEAGAQ